MDGSCEAGVLLTGDLAVSFLSKGDLEVGFLSKGDLEVGFLSKGDLEVGFLSKGDLESGDVSAPTAIGAIRRFMMRRRASTRSLNGCLPDVFGLWKWNSRSDGVVARRPFFGPLFGK